jgi:hypothetical protein
MLHVLDRRSLRLRVATFLALERNIVAVSAAMLVVALGENLWQKFLPKYLQALGAPIVAVQMTTAIAVYLPAAKIAERIVGAPPFRSVSDGVRDRSRRDVSFCAHGA